MSSNRRLQGLHHRRPCPRWFVRLRIPRMHKCALLTSLNHQQWPHPRCRSMRQRRLPTHHTLAQPIPMSPPSQLLLLPTLHLLLPTILLRRTHRHLGPLQPPIPQLQHSTTPRPQPRTPPFLPHTPVGHTPQARLTPRPRPSPPLRTLHQFHPTLPPLPTLPIPNTLLIQPHQQVPQLPHRQATQNHQA